MPDDERDRYLAELERLLPFRPARRAEILEEIGTHLDDAADERRARGIPADRAEADAQARLGTPADLARELARPEQSAWRVLAGAGAGMRASVGPWIYGYLWASVILIVAFFLAAGLAQLAGHLLSIDIQINTSGGWNSALTAFAIAVALYFAGRAATDAASVNSHRLRSEVRPWVAVAGTLVAAVILVWLMELPQNWASVIAIGLAPGAVAIGAYRPDLLPRRPGVPWVVIGGLLLLIPIGILLSAGGSVGAEGGTIDVEGAHEPDRRIELVGPWWSEEGDGQAIIGSGWGSAEGGVEGRWEVESRASLAGLRDLRAEAWHSDPVEPWRLDDRYRAPFATAPVQRDGTMLRATIVTTDSIDVSTWELILTGVGPDGVRYVLGAGSGGASSFTGSVIDWIAAVVD